MGFRNRLTTAVDTGAGNAGRVVISGFDGPNGGGAVLLYPNAGTQPGYLAAVVDSEGPETILMGPYVAPLLPSFLQLGPSSYLASQGVLALSGTDGVTLTSSAGPVTIAGLRMGDTAASNLSLRNGWTVGSEGCRYIVRHGWCYYSVHAVRNLAGVTTWAAGTAVLDFPAGARPMPSRPHRQASYGGGVNAGEFAAFPAGDAYVQYAGSSAVFVSGSFPCA